MFVWRTKNKDMSPWTKNRCAYKKFSVVQYINARIISWQIHISPKTIWQTRDFYNKIWHMQLLTTRLWCRGQSNTCSSRGWHHEYRSALSVWPQSHLSGHLYTPWWTLQLQSPFCSQYPDPYPGNDASTTNTTLKS